MSYLSLYRRFRPLTFTDVLGQAHVTETLAGAVREDRLHHAYLFSGPRGTGKTSTARILAKALNCEQGPTPTPCGTCQVCVSITEGSSLDVFEMDAASHTSVDDVREIRERIPYASAGGGTKVYIIDEAHQLSNAAFNALLKMFEEPPPHVVFVMCTTEPHRLPATVVSRCQRFEFRRLPGEVLHGHLAAVAETEGIEVEDTALSLIVRHGHGSARDALSLLDQAAGTASGSVTRQVILEILGEAPEDVLLDLAEAISEQDILGVFGRVEEMVAAGWDPRQLLVQLLEEFRALFLAHRGVTDTDIDPAHAERRRSLAQRFTSAHLEWVLQALADAQADMRLSTHPRLTLEVALARAANLEVRETQTVVARLERLERHMLQGERPASPAPSAKPRQPEAEPKPAADRQPEAPRAKDRPSETRTTELEPKVTEPEPKATEAETADEATPSAEPASEEGAPERPAANAAEGQLEDLWSVFLETVRSESRVTHTHLREAWPIEIDDQRVLVGFEKGFHANELTNRPDHVARIASALEQVFGAKLRFETEVAGRPRDAGAQAEVDVPAEDSAVDLVRKGLGAEVVEEVSKN